MASYDREKFIEDYNKKLGKDEEKVVAKTATTNAKDAFLQEYKTKYEAKYPTAKQGQNYTAPAVVQPTVKTGKELAQQQNYDQMQQFFERSKKSDEEELNRINTEISAISGYGVGADRTGLEQLLKEKDVIEQRLKVGRYDEDLTPIERLQLTAQGIGESYNYAPGVIVDTAVQALRGDKTVNMDSDAIKGMQRANQATQQAMYGKGAAGQFAWGVGGSLIDNASRMPLTLLPGGKAINSAIAGARTSAQKMVDVGENGGTARDAFLRGVGSGAVEAGTEALGFDVALNTVLKNTGEGLLKDMAINAVTGAGEEGLAYLGNLAIDKLAKDPDAKFSREDLAMAMASGAVAEGILGGGASVIGSRIRKNNVNAQSNEANRANNDAENTPKRADNIDTLDDNASRASSEGMKAKVAENPALTAENETKSSNLDSYSAENAQISEEQSERKALENEVKNIVGIDIRMEVEKVQQEQQNKIAMAEEMAAKGIASQEAVEELKTTAVEKVREAAGRQINLDYQKIDTESGAAREKAIKNGYNKVVERIEKFAAKRGLKVKFFEGDKYVSGFEKDGTIYINVTEPKVMYKTAIHETLHGLRSNNQAEYESLKKAIFDAAGKNKKLFMTGVRAEMGYVQSASESVQSSVRNDDGTINRDAVEEEVIAKMCEELIDNPQNFVEKLNGDRTAVQAIIDFVKDLIDNVYIEFSDSEKAQMKKAVREAEKALETYMEGKADTSENITKFSVNDDEYLELAKNPEANEAKLQKMVEEAANDLMADSKIRDDEGKLIPVYHGTKEDFYVFDTSVMGGKNGVQEGFGIYTTDNPNVAGSYGERKLKMYANITNPARADKKTIKAKTLAALIKDTCIRQADAMVEDGEYDSNDEAVMDTWVSNYVYTYGMGMEQAYKETAENILKQNSNDMEIVQEVMSGMAIRNYEEAMAFYHNSLMPITKIDGFVTSWENAETGGRSNIILAFDSEQLKAADPVTYGDNGDIIPLSERFKADNADIRFSVDIDNYTENSYTESIWIKDNNLVSVREYEDFISKVMSIKTGTHFEKANNGLYMIPTGDEFGVNNTIIFTDGNYNNPSVEKVVHINLKNETDIEIVRDYIYEKEKSGRAHKSSYVERVYDKEIIGQYRRYDYEDIYSASGRAEGNARTENSGHNSQQRNGRRNYKEGTGTLKGYRGENLDNYEHNRGVPQITLADGERYFITKTGDKWDDLLGMADEFDTLKVAVEYANKALKSKKSINTDDVEIPARYEGKNLAEILDMLIDEHGAIEQGENPTREIEIPKKDTKGEVVSKFARTVAEAEATPDNFAQTNLLEMTAKGHLSHEVVTDKVALQRTESLIRNKGWDEALADWKAVTKGRKAPDKYDIALGQMLYNNAVNSGDIELAQELVCDLCVQATRAGQTVQAFRLLKKLTPEGRLYMLQKSVDQINTELLDRYKTDHKDIEIPKDLANELLTAKDIETADAAVEKIEQYIADNTPVTIADKFNAWRYLAMLGNPRTHIRNVVGNVMFSPFKMGKDAVGVVLEKTLPKGEKTKAVVRKKNDAALLEFARKDFESNTDAIKGEAKYNARNSIKEKQQIFKNKYLEKARKFNAEWLEKEDEIFLKNHYVRALAGAMKANGITAKTANNAENQKLMAAIKTYATNEAQKATYRDVNVFSKAVQNVKKALNKNAVSSVFIEGVLPFARTPANVIARGVEYSPINIVRGGVNFATGGLDFSSVETVVSSTKQALKGVKSGKYTTAEALDQLSAGLTGTLICALGYILASLGIAKGKEDDGSKEGDFEKLYGMQDYALMVDGKSYTIDWAAPAAMPFFVGVELYNAYSDTENSSGIVSALLKITDPVFEMSMLDGINNAIEATAYTDTHPIIAMGASSVLNYAGQAVPTLSGQTARTLNRYRTQTYVDKNKNTPATVQRFVQQQQAKILGLNNQLSVYRDQWGRKQDNGNVGARALQNFASPGYWSTDKSTDVDNEIKRIYDEVKDAGILPTYAPKYFQLDGKYKHLTAEEYDRFAEVRGQTAYNTLDAIFKTEEYKNLDEDEQMDVIKKVYEYANEKAKAEVSDFEMSKSMKKADANPKKWLLVYGVKTGYTNKEGIVTQIEKLGYSRTQAESLYSEIK